MSEQDDREAYNAELAVVRLAPVLERIMGTCRRDLHRQMDGIDYCETCPLLTHCHAQERRTTASGAAVRRTLHAVLGRRSGREHERSQG